MENTTSYFHEFVGAVKNTLIVQPRMGFSAFSVMREGLERVKNVAAPTIGTITLVSFINPAGLEPKGQNIYAESASSGQPNAGTAGLNGLGTLMQGFVETSNVNVVQELVTMIQTQRAYEMNSKAIQTSDQMLQKLAQL